MPGDLRGGFLHEEHNFDSGSIRQFLRILRRRAPVIILCAVLVPGAAYAISASKQKQYSAAASLLFRDPAFDQKIFGSTALPPSTDPAREAATNVRLVSLEAVAARTSRRLRGRLSGSQISSKIRVSPEGLSDVVSVTATDPNPRFAASLANGFAAEYIGFRRAADRSKIREAQDLIRRQLGSLPPAQQATDGKARSLLQQLDVLGSLQTGNAELVQRATPPLSPSSPKTTENTLVGGVLGLLLGVGSVLLLERLDRRVRDPKELESLFDRPVLGAVGESRALAREKGSVGRLEVGEREAFRMLRANLRYFNVDHQVGSVLVTSAAPGDGKTTVAWNLAATAAEGGGHVLLIEADLRHPSIAEGLGHRGAAGLSTVLAAQADVDDVVQEIPLQDQGNGRGLRTLQVLLAGPLPPNPSDLLESDRMREVIANAEREYDLVVIDTPPTSVVSDAVPLVKQVGGVIVVGRIGKTTRDAATHLRNQLRNLGAPVLGVVVNTVRSDSESYGYGYGHDYGETTPEPPRASTRR
jgi:succinoglycan biosynthesis transport protein ExoP